MNGSTFTFRDHDSLEIFVYKWAPADRAKGAVQIAHGMAEHAGRYARAAEALARAGYVVYANDHRGHGKTAVSPQARGDLGPGGWWSVLRDMRQLTGIIAKENPGLPIFLLGHSMGSFLTQQYIQENSKAIKGAVLSGSNGKDSALALFVGRLMAARAMKKLGPLAPAEKMNKSIFRAYNSPFEPAKTPFDWLSRDEAEVNKYVDDPMCGFVCPNGFFVEFLGALAALWKPVNEKRIRADLPVYVFSGSADPVGKAGKGVTLLCDRYRAHGLADVTLKLYPGGRHEMFNETNRDEVYRDLVRWLDAHLS